MSIRPLEVELVKLPCRAVAAFALRCSMRVLPLYASMYGRTSKELFRHNVRAMFRAIHLAVQFARNDSSQLSVTARMAALRCSGRAFSYAYRRALRDSDDSAVAAAAFASRSLVWSTEIVAVGVFYESSADVDGAECEARAADCARIGVESARAMVKAVGTNAKVAEAHAESDSMKAESTNVARIKYLKGVRHAALEDLKSIALAVHTGGLEEFTIDLDHGDRLGPFWPDNLPDWYLVALNQWETVLKELGLDLHGKELSTGEMDNPIMTNGV
jgi:hypothetical protein